MKTVAFFNNKGGLGRTTLVYHLTWIKASTYGAREGSSALDSSRFPDLTIHATVARSCHAG